MAPETPSPAGGLDTDQLLELIRLVNASRSDDIAAMADRVGRSLADRFGQQTALGARLDEGRIRDYEITRRQLAGPADDEADTLGIGTIVLVAPIQVIGGRLGDWNPAPIRTGERCGVLLRNAGNPTSVDFATKDGSVTGSIVLEVQRSAMSGPGFLQLAVVEVPDDAVTGPVTAVTDSGDITSGFDVTVMPGTAPRSNPRRNDR